MKKSISCAMVSALCLIAGTGHAMSHGNGDTKAWAEIRDSAGKKVGKATLTEQKDGVKLAIDVTGLTPGKHGFHIHENGNCTPPDFKSAGGHYNPFDKKHGSLDPAGKHLGDLQNLDVARDGSAKVSVVVDGATLKEGKKGTLFPPGGTAIVIHAKPDDYKTDPAGDAGNRVACGVILRKVK